MPHYDLCIIGSGSGNTLVDERFDDWRIAIVDDGPTYGGTCLNRGCIPTKMFAYPADLVRTPWAAERVGVSMDAPRADFAAIRDRTFGRIDPISSGGEAWRARASNIDLYRATGRFTGPKTLDVDGTTVTADRFVLAAGSRPVWPDIPGLDAPELAPLVHTSDTIMRVDQVPARLVILGGGYIGAEFAHIFSAMGSDVTVVTRGPRALRREDDEISTRFTAALAREATVLTSASVTSVAPEASGLVVSVVPDGVPRDLHADALLVAVGRRPNGDRLNVAATGVALDDAGYVVVDDRQATTVDGIWALGDVCSPAQLKHVANAEARTVQHNLLHPDDLASTDHRFIPHAVFGHPQVASVGMTEDAARAAGLDVAVAVQEYATVAYGWAMEDTTSCVKLVADRATKHLVGAHIVGPEAAILLQPLVQAMSLGTDVPTMARGQYWIHPALTEVIENALLSLDLEENR